MLKCALKKELASEHVYFKSFNILIVPVTLAKQVQFHRILGHPRPTAILPSAHFSTSSGEITSRLTPRRGHCELFIYMGPRETGTRHFCTLCLAGFSVVSIYE